jgi:hypothetical protein
MGKHPQDRLRRLAIVGPADGKPQHQPAAGQRWWGPKRPGIHETTREKAHFKSLRMAVMPTLTRGMWIEAMAWLRDFLRSYFVAGGSRRQRAVVLSFRSHALRAHAFRRAEADDQFVGKKANGSVRWNNDRGVAPQEGGRG